MLQSATACKSQQFVVLFYQDTPRSILESNFKKWALSYVTVIQAWSNPAQCFSQQCCCKCSLGTSPQRYQG